MPDLPEAAKDRGHLAELMFALEAKKRGHIICTPGGDNCPFDVVLYNTVGRFIRVQVKSCLRKEPGRTRHSFTVKKGGKNKQSAYHKEDIDVLALYTYDEDVWFFVPIEVVGLDTTVKIEPGGKYDIFRGNWDIFK